MINLKPFQNEAVTSLLRSIRKLDTFAEPTECVFKSPTGSGKTIMIAEFLKQLLDEDLNNDYVYIWASVYSLHSQSQEKLRQYLTDTRYNFLTLEDLSSEALGTDTILFTNWHSLTTTTKIDDGSRTWSNVSVREREDGRSIVDVLEKSRGAGRKIVLIVDESHTNYHGENSQRFVSEVIQPSITLEVSATPLMNPNPSEMARGAASWVEVAFEDVVASGLIKQETIINQGIEGFVDIKNSSDDIILEAGLAKRKELRRAYESEGIDVNPLLLVQLPSGSQSTSALDTSVREQVEAQLKSYDITIENGKLAVWLSEEKTDNLEHITNNSDATEVLIFKEAIAVGWDCPRAQILVMMREIGSITFEIQTVGRILRTPEAKHYKNRQLNQALIYTNVERIAINQSPEDLDFFKTKEQASLLSNIDNVALPSVYLHRRDYGDLTASFIAILVNELNARAGVSDADMVDEAYEKAEVHLTLNGNDLKRPILADVVIENIDAAADDIGSLDMHTIQSSVSPQNIERQFDHLMKAWSFPFAPVRSFGKIKSGIYQWFARIGLGDDSVETIQKIVACSRQNQNFLDEAIKAAKDTFAAQIGDEIQRKRDRTDFIFSLPQHDEFGDNYEAAETEKSPYDICYLRKDRSNPEKRFESMLESSDAVKWWYKNGEGRDCYFAIPYNHVDEQSGERSLKSFYPDYIVKFIDGSVGIFDTKSGNIITDKATYQKSDALQDYLSAHDDLWGGILNSRQEGLYLFTGKEYSPELSKWNLFTLRDGNWSMFAGLSSED